MELEEELPLDEDELEEDWEDLDDADFGEDDYYGDGEEIIIEDWDRGTVADELKAEFDVIANDEKMEFNGTADIELKNEGRLKFGEEITLEAKVQDVNVNYRLIWEANDSDGRGWFSIASGEQYSYTLTQENLERQYRVVLYSVD